MKSNRKNIYEKNLIVAVIGRLKLLFHPVVFSISVLSGIIMNNNKTMTQIKPKYCLFHPVVVISL